MRHFTLSIFITFIFFQISFSQNEFIVTLKRDTLYGNVKRAFFSTKRVVHFEANGEKKSYNINELLEYSDKGKSTYIVKLRRKSKIHYLELVTVVDGKIKLLDNIADDDWDFYLLVDKKFVPLTASNVSFYLWPNISTCKVVQEKYPSLTLKKLKKWRSNRNRIGPIIELYNRSCQ
jgi:hypothetical protein